MMGSIQDQRNNKKVFGKTVSAFFLSHVGGLLIANIFCFGLSSLFSGYGYLAVIPAILLLYSYPVYSTMWNAGHRDVNAAQFGHMSLNRFAAYGIASLEAFPLSLFQWDLFYQNLGCFLILSFRISC